MTDPIARLEKSLEDVARSITGSDKAWSAVGEARSTDEMNRWLTRLVTPSLATAADHMCGEVLEAHSDADAEKTRVVHYTSLGATVSMLEAAANARGKDPAVVDPKPVFRLYDSAHLNDPDEGRYVLRKLAESYEWLVEFPSRNAYIASFITPEDTGAIDNLSFWRAYGDEGTGCSLSLHVPVNLARRVLYGSKSVDMVRNRLRPMLEALDRVAVAARERPLEKVVRGFLAQAAAESLEPIRYLYKSKAYEYEKECRVITTLTNDRRPTGKSCVTCSQDDVRFECRAHAGRPAHIRHYCEPPELSMRKLLASGTEIVIGPRVPEPESVRSCFRTLLRRADIDGPEVRISEISYQAF